MMIAGAVFVLTLVVTVAVEPNVPTGTNVPGTQISLQQKNAVMQPLLRSATECIIRAVTADPRIKISTAAVDLNDLIVASTSSCVDALRAMIDAHDRLFGEGTGEAFFMGPYLDMLPKAVTKQVKGGLQ
jgi:hypothetical protein